MTVDRPSPRQTGRADFPHPAFAELLCARHSQGRRLLFGVRAQLRSPVPEVLSVYRSGLHLSNQLRFSLSPLRSAKAPWLHGRYPASTLLWASPTPQPPAPALWIRRMLRSALAEPGAGVSQPAQPHLPCALPPTTPEVSAAAREHPFTTDDRLRHIREIGRPHLA
jgi:hypothetical protein